MTGQWSRQPSEVFRRIRLAPVARLDTMPKLGDRDRCDFQFSSGWETSQPSNQTPLSARMTMSASIIICHLSNDWFKILRARLNLYATAARSAGESSACFNASAQILPVQTFQFQE